MTTLQAPPLTPENSVAILKGARHTLHHHQAWTTKAYARTAIDANATKLSLMDALKSWLTPDYARTPVGKRVHYADPNAVRFSLMGAVRRAKHNLGFDPNAHDDCRRWLKLAVDRYCRKYPEHIPASAEGFNDARKRKHVDVLKVLDDAIAIGEEFIRKRP